MKVADKIIRQMRRFPARVFGPKDFLDLGARTAIDKALSRLTRQGDVRRVARGMYDVPRTSALLGTDAPPDVGAVLDAVRRRFQVQIAPDHAAAANAMGLTTAVPVRLSYLADRPIGSVRVGSRTIAIKSAGRALSPWLGNPAAPIVQSLIWLRNGDFDVGDEIIATLRRNSTNKARTALALGMHRLPGWAIPAAQRIIDGASVR